MRKDIKISPVGLQDQDEIIAYVLETRKLLFPMLDHSVIPKDLQNFSEAYMDVPIGTFLQARTIQGELIGTVGIIAYDGRFPYLSFADSKVVEVVKLFVEPAYRQSGLGTALVRAMREIGQQQGVDVFYLHTHPFLDGAYDFWQKQGFDLVFTSKEWGFETLHMVLDKNK